MNFCPEIFSPIAVCSCTPTKLKFAPFFCCPVYRLMAFLLHDLPFEILVMITCTMLSVWFTQSQLMLWISRLRQLPLISLTPLWIRHVFLQLAHQKNLLRVRKVIHVVLVPISPNQLYPPLWFCIYSVGTLVWFFFVIMMEFRWCFSSKVLP